MNNFWTLAIKNPKTTLSGIFSFVAITALAITPYVTNPKYSAALAIAAGLAKVYIRAISQDSGVQLALVPDQSEPQMVSSHETPDSPSAIPIKE